MHRILDTALAPDAPIRELEGTDCGAIVSFTGSVRAQNRGRQVVSLEYEVYDAMALKVFSQIEATAHARWPGSRLAIHHRKGLLLPGELSVVIAAATPHRADAFECCRMAIEALKTDAPIWKHERYPDGSSWIGLGS